MILFFTSLDRCYADNNFLEGQFTLLNFFLSPDVYQVSKRTLNDWADFIFYDMCFNKQNIVKGLITGRFGWESMSSYTAGIQWHLSEQSEMND